MNAWRRGFTLVELLLVLAVIGIVAAIALPSLVRARTAANESSAIASLRNINSGQQAFWSSCGGGMYSSSLQNLALPIAGVPGYISPDLSGPKPIVKSGYDFDMGTAAPSPRVSCNGGTLVGSYHSTADPLPGMGGRYFGSNSGGALYQSSATLLGIMPDAGAPPPPAIPLAQ